MKESIMLKILVTIIVLFICTILIFKYHHFVNSKNEYTHADLESSYGHMSKVDRINYLIYPRLLFTHPIHLELNEGDALKIPKNWWHWVKSYGHTFSVNFWFKDANLKHPEKIKYNNTVDTSLLDDQMVSIWDNNDIQVSYKDKYSNFLKNKIPNQYVITLNNYNPGSMNQKIKDIYKDKIIPPEHILNNNLKYDFNIWISSEYNDTGLHYDDDDGILCVLKGKKKVILYPPSDTHNLYPIKMKHEWLNNKALNFRYNSYTRFNQIDGLPSSRLLNELCFCCKEVKDIITDYYNKYGPNKTVWGFKKHGSVYRLEFYVYDLQNKQNNIISSRDIFYKKPFISDEIHYYHKLNKYNKEGKHQFPFWGNGSYIKNNKKYEESKIFLIDKYETFKNNYDEYMDKLDYEDIKEDFKTIILDKYECYEICIHNKHPEQIFVQYLGISNEDFTSFLIDNEYEQKIINYYKNNFFNINNEITIVYDIKTKKSIRSGFYGIF